MPNLFDLTPVTEPPRRPSQEQIRRSLQGVAKSPDIQYLRSYLLMRTLIGALGLAIPLVLLTGEWFFGIPADAWVRGSLSAYYHSGLRDFFVAAMCISGVFLITYKVFERHVENALSFVAGFAAIVVALFPTGRPPIGNISPTPLQQAWGEDFVAAIHFTAAAIFVLSLAVICFFFGQREGKRGASSGKIVRPHVQRFHRICGVIIVGAVVAIIATNFFGVWDEHSLLIGEIVAVSAFAISWLVKGMELDMLFPARRTRREIAIDTGPAHGRLEPAGGE